jgi:hypothetical protein
MVMLLLSGLSGHNSFQFRYFSPGTFLYGANQCADYPRTIITGNAGATPTVTIRTAANARQSKKMAEPSNSTINGKKYTASIAPSVRKNTFTI